MRRIALVTGIAGVVAAAGARRPLLRRWPVSMAQAAPCLPASEAPGVLTAVHAAIGVAAFLR
ncbi:MAG: hypothetical protein QOG20_5041, partial [Pseudonocardiales bacterium]|nr:hypothetical protein [Pseudonocardiales bacterium]